MAEKIPFEPFIKGLTKDKLQIPTGSPAPFKQPIIAKATINAGGAAGSATVYTIPKGFRFEIHTVMTVGYGALGGVDRFAIYSRAYGTESDLLRGASYNNEAFNNNINYRGALILEEGSEIKIAYTANIYCDWQFFGFLVQK